MAGGTEERIAWEKWKEELLLYLPAVQVLILLGIPLRFEDFLPAYPAVQSKMNVTNINSFQAFFAD